MSEKIKSNKLIIYSDQMAADCPVCDGLINEETPLVLTTYPDYVRKKCPWCYSPLEITVIMRNKELGYVPGELKFIAHAVIDGKIEVVGDGHYWLPEGQGDYTNCYPVRVSSEGIHYKRKITDKRACVCDGTTYYAYFECENIHNTNVTLYLKKENKSETV